MKVSEAIQVFIQSRIATGCREGTIYNYSHYLQRFASDTLLENIESCTWETVRNWITSLKNAGLKNSTIELRRVFIITWLEWLFSEGYIDRGEWTRHVRPLRVDKGRRRCLNADECRAFLLAAEYMPYKEICVHHRNVAMVYMFLDTGLRKSELTNLKLQDVDLTGRKIIVSEGCKGRAARIVPFTAVTLRKLRAYLHVRGKVDSDYLWITDLKTKPSTQIVYKLIKTIALEAGIAEVTVHSLRHSFATQCLENGMSLDSLRELLGHRKLSTTMIYVHGSRDRAIREYEAISPIARIMG